MGVVMKRLAVVKDEPHPSWSCSGFNEFRARVAKAVGITLSEMEGYVGWGKPFDPEHPLTPFLYHSDCDGVWTADECGRIAPALRPILESWPDDDYDKEEGLLLVEMMETTAEEYGYIELF